MQDWIGSGLKMFIEGSLKAKALAAGLKAIDALRQLFILNQVFTMVCMLCAMSAFGGGFVLLNHEAPLEFRSLPPAFTYCAVVFIITAFLLWYTGRRKTWISAAGLQERFEKAAPQDTPRSSVDVQELASLIEQIIEKKLDAKIQGRSSRE